MNLLAPLGLLGLLSIAVLILIYILKPNYQQKLISSTHVWKLSLKYRKKRIPISRFRNILLIICQILILTSLAFILAKPVIPGEKLKDDEKVFIIDASASMLVESGLETRFERAVFQIQSEVKDTLENGGTVSVIVADEEPYFVVQRSTSADLAVVSDKLDELIRVDNMKCSYASADMEEAVELAQDVVTQNPEAEVFFYTATTYLDQGNIQVVDVAAFEDWNAAVLGCEAVIGDDNYYTISIDVGCYGRSETVKVYCEIVSPNGEYNTSVTLESDEEFFNVMEQEKTFVFNAAAQQDQLGYSIYSFEYLYVHVEETDGFAEDNSFYLYGGIKEKVRIQYASSAPNNFFSSGFITLREIYKNTWDIDFDEVMIDPKKKENEQEYELEGYNLYIFEHTMPSVLPDDGIVLLVDPDTEPKNVGLRLGGAQYVYANSTLTRGNDHPLLSYITPEQITISKYTRVISNDGYDELMYYGNEPVLLAKNESDMKVVVMALDLNFSNLAVLFDFPAFLYNIFNYYMPPTLTDFTYEIGDLVTLNARSETLTVSGGTYEDVQLTSFPTQILVTAPGTYTLTQVAITGDFIIENFFVGISNYESDIMKEVEELPELYIQVLEEQEDKDLLLIFAAVLVALLFLEWWLQARENF